MRISDWSSDVCSSDLNSALVLDVGLSTAMDDVAAAREIAEHVVGLGHRTIAIIMGDPAHAASAQRLVGYLQAFELGRASCRERVCQYVLISVVSVSFI